jgi:hypothetical protein
MDAIWVPAISSFIPSLTLYQVCFLHLLYCLRWNLIGLFHEWSFAEYTRVRRMTTVAGYYLIMDKCIKNKLNYNMGFYFLFYFMWIGNPRWSLLQNKVWYRFTWKFVENKNSVLRQLKDLTEIKFHIRPYGKTFSRKL